MLNDGVRSESGADAMGPESAVPYLTARLSGGTSTYVSCVVLDAAGFDPGAAPGAGTTVRAGR